MTRITKSGVLLIITVTAIVLATPNLTVQAYPGIQKVPPQNLPWYPIAAFGDNRPENLAAIQLPSIYHQLIEEVETSDPFALLGTGDHVGSGRLDQIVAFLNTLTDIENVILIEGNHDVGPAHDYWLKEVAPQMYFWDGIPGWRVVLFSTEMPRAYYQKLKSFLETALNTTRHIVLVFHRPAYPDISYNMDPDMRSILMKEVRKYGNVEIALQGHWHGFVEEDVNGTLFIITGGAGAPLYQSGGKNHYLYLVIEPNGKYEIIPVSLGYGSGSIEVLQSNNELIIRNTKLAINGSPVSIPVRAKLPLSNIDVFAVMMAPPGTTELRATVKDDKIVVSTNSSMRWYIYYETLEGAVVNATDSDPTLSLPAPTSVGYITVTATTHNLIMETITVTLPRTTTKTVLSTTTETLTATTTHTVTETVTKSRTETTTYTKTETTTSNTLSATNLGIAVIVGAASGLIAYSIRKRK